MERDASGGPEEEELFRLGEADSIELVRRAQAGSEEALDELLRRYYPIVVRKVRELLGPALRTHLESMDIAQEVLVEALRDFDRFEMRDESSLVNWLAKIVTNKIRGAADYFGAQKRESGRAVPLDSIGSGSEAAGLLASLAGSTRQPLERVLSDENRLHLERCIARLSADSAATIRMRYFEGADWRTIAGRLGLESPDAARMRCKRAIVELERIWGRS